MTPSSLGIRVIASSVLLLGAFGAAPAQTTGGAGGTAETSNPAPAVAAQMAPGTIELIPPAGPVGEEVRIVGAGLTPNAPVVVLGGPDAAQLVPLGPEEGNEQRQGQQQALANQPEHVDTSGAFRTLVRVPDVPYGSQFFFALKVGDQVTEPMAYLVEAREPSPTNN